MPAALLHKFLHSSTSVSVNNSNPGHSRDCVSLMPCGSLPKESATYLTYIHTYLVFDDRNSRDEQQGERAREENLRKRIAAESRIRSVLQGRIPNSTYIDIQYQDSESGSRF